MKWLKSYQPKVFHLNLHAKFLTNKKQKNSLSAQLCRNQYNSVLTTDSMCTSFTCLFDEKQFSS